MICNFTIIFPQILQKFSSHHKCNLNCKNNFLIHRQAIPFLTQPTRNFNVHKKYYGSVGRNTLILWFTVRVNEQGKILCIVTVFNLPYCFYLIRLTFYRFHIFSFSWEDPLRNSEQRIKLLMWLACLNWALVIKYRLQTREALFCRDGLCALSYLGCCSSQRGLLTSTQFIRVSHLLTHTHTLQFLLWHELSHNSQRMIHLLMLTISH